MLNKFSPLCTVWNLASTVGVAEGGLGVIDNLSAWPLCEAVWPAGLLSGLAGRHEGKIARAIMSANAITVDTALRLARYFGTSPEVWLRLQVQYDLEAADQRLRQRIDREVKAYKQPAAN